MRGGQKSIKVLKQRACYTSITSPGTGLQRATTAIRVLSPYLSKSMSYHRNRGGSVSASSSVGCQPNDHVPPKSPSTAQSILVNPLSHLMGGGIWRDGDLIGWMSCAKDNSSCTLNFEGRRYGKDEEGRGKWYEGETPWFEVKITFNTDRSVKFLSGAVSPHYGEDEYFIVWHSRNLSQ